MTQGKARKILAGCFENLPKQDRNRLWWHYEQKTGILCGKKASVYTSEEGFA